MDQEDEEIESAQVLGLNSKEDECQLRSDLRSVRGRNQRSMNHDDSLRVKNTLDVSDAFVLGR